MIKFLIIEDDQDVANSIQNELTRAGYIAHSLTYPRSEVLIPKVLGWLRINASEDDPLDFFVLDIQTVDDPLGGLDLYVEILRQGLRRRFKHVLICTQYVSIGGENLDVIKGFCKGALIPYHSHVMGKLMKRSSTLFDKINLLLQEANPIITIAEYWSRDGQHV